LLLSLEDSRVAARVYGTCSLWRSVESQIVGCFRRGQKGRLSRYKQQPSPSLFVVPSLLPILQVVTHFVTLVPLALIVTLSEALTIVQCLALPIVTRRYLSAEPLDLSPTKTLIKQIWLWLSDQFKATMKQSILLLGLSASATLANIYFPKVQPTCDSQDLQFSGCLKGQVCQQNNTYVARPCSRRHMLRMVDALL
jgi:hypothetical protein